MNMAKGKKPKIVIVAGGLATRMKPITEEIPKCLVDIHGKPLIQHQIEFFKEHGYNDFIFCVAHLANKVKEYFEDGSKFGINIKYSEEQKELLGTAGSVKLIENIIGEDENFIVYYGDNLTCMDFERYTKFHIEHDSIATICIRPLKQGYKSSSVITLDENNKIKVFLEKPSIEEINKYEDQQKYINSGIYVFNKKIFEYIPSNQKYDFAKEVFPKLIQNNNNSNNNDQNNMYGYPTNEYFREIGRIEKYNSFLNESKGKKNIFMKNKAIFLDRDGVINKNFNDMKTPEQFEIISGVPQAIKKINDAGYLAIIVTNQPTISKGIISFEDINKIHDKMNKELAEQGAHIDAIYICPHHPDSGFEGEIKHLKFNCDCRKPKPGLLLNAIAENNIDIQQSWMIGDSNSDIVAGKNAGVKTIYVTAGGGSGSKHEKEHSEAKPDFSASDLLNAVNIIIM